VFKICNVYEAHYNTIKTCARNAAEVVRVKYIEMPPRKPTKYFNACAPPPLTLVEVYSYNRMSLKYNRGAGICGPVRFVTIVFFAPTAAAHVLRDKSCSPLIISLLSVKNKLNLILCCGRVRLPSNLIFSLSAGLLSTDVYLQACVHNNIIISVLIYCSTT